MEYQKLLVAIATAKAPKRTNAWKVIVGNPTAFKSWFYSLSSTEEQKIKASMPQLFAALSAAPANRVVDEPTPVATLPADSFEGGLATRYGLMEVEVA